MSTSNRTFARIVTIYLLISPLIIAFLAYKWLEASKASHEEAKAAQVVKAVKVNQFDKVKYEQMIDEAVQNVHKNAKTKLTKVEEVRLINEIERDIANLNN
jgi:hypothetical protein